MTVGDVGAGSGYYTVRLTALLGASGAVIAQDVKRTYLAQLAARLDRYSCSLARIPSLPRTAQHSEAGGKARPSPGRRETLPTPRRQPRFGALCAPRAFATFWACKSACTDDKVNGESCVVHIIRDAVPGLVLVLVLVMAALPAERIAASSTRGRARTAVAYLAGFGSGLLISVFVGTFAGLRRDPQPLSALCLMGSFVGPFFGLASASFHRPRRRRRRLHG